MDGRRARRTQNYDTRAWSIEHYTKSYVKFQLIMSKNVEKSAENYVLQVC